MRNVKRDPESRIQDGHRVILYIAVDGYKPFVYITLPSGPSLVPLPCRRFAPRRYRRCQILESYKREKNERTTSRVNVLSILSSHVENLHASVPH